jgi:ABC-type nitrate/sulfonate/bicarbonate transport system ATPase subunit
MAFGVINNVRKVFQLEEIGWSALEPIVALDDASFRFEEGELVALLGPSGCGKTTLLRIIGGLIAKTAGSVAIDGREVTKPVGDYGFVFQTPSLMPWRNVRGAAARPRASGAGGAERLSFGAAAPALRRHAAARRALSRARSPAAALAHG